jgi:nucleotide-binding universal stress UspA family protein
VREEELEDLSEQRAREVLDTAVEKVRSAGTTVAQTHLREGCRTRSSPWPRTWGSGGRGREQRSGRDKEALMGSVSDAVVRHAYCPVLVVRR